MEHGYNRYTRGCRCEVCREAKAAYMRDKRKRAGAVRGFVEHHGRSYGGRNYVDGITHGTAGYRDASCRCETCRATKSAEWQRLKARQRA